MTKIILLLLIISLSSLVNAFDVTVPEDTVISSIGDITSFNITLKSDINDRIILSSTGKPWITIVNSQPSLIRNTPEKITIYLSPYETTDTGLYKISLTFTSEITNEKSSRDVYISVLRKEGVVIKKITTQGSLEPLGYIDVDICGNNYGEKIDKASLELSLGDLYKKTLDLKDIPKGESKIVSARIDIDKQVASGEYLLSAKITAANRSSSFNIKLEIEKKHVIKQSLEEKSLLFGSKKIITVKNYGNDAASRVTIGDKINLFEAIFYSGDKPITETDSVFLWEIKDLKPGEEAKIQYKIDYTPLVMFIFAILLFAWYVAIKLRTFRIRKYVIQKKSITEGEEFTIAIDVRNAVGKMVDNINVRDIIPPVFELKLVDGPQPKKKKTQAGIELSWKLEDFKPREERVLLYKIVPVFGVHGTVRLPKAMVKFSVGGRDYENTSKLPHLGIEEDTHYSNVTVEDILKKRKKEE